MWLFGKKEAKKQAVLRLEAADLPPQRLKAYRKSALSRARLLTDGDLSDRGGIIETKEGPVPFEVGDYLNRGVDGEEWPMKAAEMLSTKEAVSEPEVGGWRNWRNTNTVRAMQIDQPFEVKLVNGSDISGKAGDFFVDGGSSQWIVDADIFKRTYIAA